MGKSGVENEAAFWK